MRVEPQITSPDPVLVNLGGGFATVFNTQTVQTTVQAADGETVILGGLISKSNTRQETKIPVLGDLPWVGSAFRFRVQDQARRELIFIMTPHIVRDEADRARIAAQEAARYSNLAWTDVNTIHGGQQQSLLTGQPCPPRVYQGVYPVGPNGAVMYDQPVYTEVPLGPGTGVPAQPMVPPQQQTTVPGAVPIPAPRQVMPGVLPGSTPPSGAAPIFPQPGPAPAQMPPGGGAASGFPATQNGRPTVFGPPTDLPVAQPTPPPQPEAKEGQTWNVFGR
jgi:hypothetical protein